MDNGGKTKVGQSQPVVAPLVSTPKVSTCYKI